MFEKKTSPKDTETIIGAGVEVEGTFSANGNVIINGRLKGSLETKSDLYAEEGSLIEADVKANNAYISGKIKGNVEVEGKLILGKSGVILGDISCQSLKVEEGAEFNGQCRMGKKASQIKTELQEEKEEEKEE